MFKYLTEDSSEVTLSDEKEKKISACSAIIIFYKIVLSSNFDKNNSWKFANFRFMSIRIFVCTKYNY